MVSFQGCENACKYSESFSLVTLRKGDREVAAGKAAVGEVTCMTSCLDLYDTATTQPSIPIQTSRGSSTIFTRWVGVRSTQSSMVKKRSHELTSESFESLLTHLADSPSTYTPEELSDSLDHLFNPDSCTEYQIGAFLALLRASGLEGRPDMISMAAQSMRDRAVRVELEQEDGAEGWADLVGTGGDGKDTFNVSTTAALVAAGAGVKICKVRES